MTRHEILKEFEGRLNVAGISQTKAAVHIGICPQYLNQILRGHKMPSDEVIQAIMELSEKLKNSGLAAG